MIMHNEEKPDIILYIIIYKYVSSQQWHIKVIVLLIPRDDKVIKLHNTTWNIRSNTYILSQMIACNNDANISLGKSVTV